MEKYYYIYMYSTSSRFKKRGRRSNSTVEQFPITSIDDVVLLPYARRNCRLFGMWIFVTGMYISTLSFRLCEQFFVTYVMLIVFAFAFAFAVFLLYLRVLLQCDLLLRSISILVRRWILMWRLYFVQAAAQFLQPDRTRRVRTASQKTRFIAFKIFKGRNYVQQQ